MEKTDKNIILKMEKEYPAEEGHKYKVSCKSLRKSKSPRRRRSRSKSPRRSPKRKDQDQKVPEEDQDQDQKVPEEDQDLVIVFGEVICL